MAFRTQFVMLQLLLGFREDASFQGRGLPSSLRNYTERILLGMRTYKDDQEGNFEEPVDLWNLHVFKSTK